MMKVAYIKAAEQTENVESCILKILAYFSLFDYPLTRDEIEKFLPPSIDATTFDKGLAHVVAARIVFRIDEFYLLQNNSQLVKRRKEGNARASVMLPKAIKVGKFLSGFPFVTGIGISGSLSKNFASEKADFDFFIITKGNRLWVARTIMHIFKKLTYLTGSQHYYCMNYYVDEESLKLRDQNAYTAIEILTLVPVNGKSLHDFFKANDWVGNWFASYPPICATQYQMERRPVFKRVMEWLLNNKGGSKLDDYLMKITSRRWKKKAQQRKRNDEGKEMALVTGKHFAWSNPDSFQEKIVTLYNNKIAELQSKYPQHFVPVSVSFEE